MGRISQEGSLMIALFENFEELKTFAFEISQCTKYKNYAQNPSKFEELQHITLEALTSLRIVISDKDAENLFKILLFEIPIKHSTSNFVKNFNEKTYQLFSDWLAHMPIAATIALIAQLLSENGEYNLNLVFIHAMQWLLTVELTSANFEINAIAPVLPVLVKGLAGIPIINSHPLSDSTLQLMIATSESFLTFLLEKFQENALSRFVDSQLVNHGKLLNIYLN